jgi:hypothetical protein
VLYEVPTAKKILEEKGLAVDPVHNSAPKSPPSPNQPPKVKIIALVSE